MLGYLKTKKLEKFKKNIPQFLAICTLFMANQATAITTADLYSFAPYGSLLKGNVKALLHVDRIGQKKDLEMESGLPSKEFRFFRIAKSGLADNWKTFQNWATDRLNGENLEVVKREQFGHRYQLSYSDLGHFLGKSTDDLIKTEQSGFLARKWLFERFHDKLVATLQESQNRGDDFDDLTLGNIAYVLLTELENAANQEISADDLFEYLMQALENHLLHLKLDERIKNGFVDSEGEHRMEIMNMVMDTLQNSPPIGIARIMVKVLNMDQLSVLAYKFGFTKTQKTYSYEAISDRMNKSISWIKEKEAEAMELVKEEVLRRDLSELYPFILGNN